MKPYAYLIGWSREETYYYGARWAKDCCPSDLWVTYFTSSKYVKKFREKFGEPDIIIIRKTFNDSKKCKLYENKVLTRMNVLSDDRWLNKNINGNYLPDGPQSDEHISKRIKSSLNTKIKNGTLNNIAWTNESHPESGKKISDKLTGVKKSKEHIKSMKNRPQDSTFLKCPHCNKEGDYKNMKRWHMDRCKHNPNRSTDKDPKNIKCNVCGYETKQSPNFYKNHNSNCKS